MRVTEHPKPPMNLPKGSPPPPPPGPGEVTICNWCGCSVDERQADIDGNHKDFTSCIEAQKRKIKNLTQELIDERVLTAQLTERLEVCRTCPLADYEEPRKEK